MLELQQLLAAPWSQGVLTSILTIITAIYAYLTWSIARSNKSMTTAMLRPVIGARIAIRQGVIIALIIENTGRSIAKNISINIDRDFFQYDEKDDRRNIKNFHAFSKVIKSMAPDEKIQFDLSQGFNLGKEVDGKIITPFEFDLDISYEFGKSNFKETQQIDLRQYINSLALKDPLENLEQIEKHLKKISQS